jgi:hypothetical protein
VKDDDCALLSKSRAILKAKCSLCSFERVPRSSKLTLSNDLALAFNMGRLVGLISGVALAIILGQFVFITFPLTFYLGFLLLVVATLRLFIIEMITTLAFVPSDPQRRDRVLFA